MLPNFYFTSVCRIGKFSTLNKSFEKMMVSSKSVGQALNEVERFMEKNR